MTRFTRSQVALLDAVLATLPDASVDDTFEKARAQLVKFDAIAPRDPPASFRGTLRDYQREGLGWLRFLRAPHQSRRRGRRMSKEHVVGQSQRF